MFSVLVQIPSSSLLGQRMPFLQHIAAVAFVRSVRTKEGYKVCMADKNKIKIKNFIISDKIR